jgi:hypothetical protein
MLAVAQESGLVFIRIDAHISPRRRACDREGGALSGKNARAMRRGRQGKDSFSDSITSFVILTIFDAAS